MLILSWGLQAVNNPENTKSAIPRKPVRHGSDKTPSKYFSFYPSPIRLMIVIVLSVFLCEAFVMVIIHPMYHLSPWFLAIFDAIILTLLISPVLYLLVFRPLVQRVHESKKAEQFLRENELRFQTVFQTSPDAVMLSRLNDGLIEEVNEGFVVLTKYSEQEVKGRTSLDINIWVNPKDREKMVGRLQKDGELEHFETEVIRKDGRLISVLITAKVIMLNDEPHILSVSRDITGLKKAQKILEASHQFLQIANRYNEMNPLLTEFIAVIKELTNCSAAGIRILDEDGKIPYQAFEGFSEQFYESENSHTLDSINCMCANVVLQKTDLHHPYFTEAGSFCINSTTRFLKILSQEEKAQTCDVCSKDGYESVALVPIRLGDKILGLIHVGGPRPNMFPSENIELLEGASMQLGAAIERVRAEEALQESHRKLEKRVENRTAQLLSANELLKIEIEERKLKEKKLLEQQDKLRSLSSKLLLTEERERRRIAIELHDRIGQTLAITKIKLGELRETTSSNSAAKALDEIREFVSQTIRDTRSLTFELSPPVLHELGLEAALAWLANQTREKHGLQIELKDDGKSKPLDDSCRVIAFQATRELLFNIVKHAQARSAKVSVRRDNDSIRIEIEDDGIGFDISEIDSIESSSRGFGLFSLRERLSPLGGRIEIQSGTGNGTRAIIVLPMACKLEDTEE